MERALADSSIDWAENLRELWQRRFAGLPGDARERAKQGRFLLYRGFTHEAVSRLLRGAGDN
ncbi:recombination regulator RecX [compost metagenome]